MPIYAYKCESCGFAKDVLQKISDAPLQDCPTCAQPTFKKQLTAAGFQLKGSGWYVTDFKGGTGGTAAPATGAAAATTDSTAATPTTTAPASDTSSSGGTSAAGGCGTSCACH